MPLLGYAASHASVSFSATLALVFAVFVKLSLAMASAFFLARTAIRPVAGIMETFASPELLQLCALAFCMVIAWTSDQMVCAQLLMATRAIKGNQPLVLRTAT